MRLTLYNDDYVRGALIWLVLAFHNSSADNSIHQNATGALSGTINGPTAMPRSQADAINISTTTSSSAFGMTSAPDGTSYAGNTSHTSYIRNYIGTDNTTTRSTTHNVTTVASTSMRDHGEAHIHIRKTSGSASLNAPKPFGCMCAIPIVVTMLVILMR